MPKQISPESAIAFNEGYRIVPGDHEGMFHLERALGGGASFMRGKPVDAEIGQVVESDCFYIEDIAVPSTQQGAGAGYEIMKKCIDIAKNEDFAFMRLEAISLQVISLAEKAVKQGDAAFAAYAVSRSTSAVSTMPTEQLFESPARIDSSAALKLLKQRDKDKAEANDMGLDYAGDIESVNCILIIR
jgi:hypothetical protein